MSKTVRLSLAAFSVMASGSLLVGGSGLYHAFILRAPNTWFAALFAPISAIGQGDLAIPCTSYMVMIYLIIIIGCWLASGLARYISYQLMVIASAVSLAVMITILLDSQLFEHDKFFFPWPYYLFTIIEQSQQSGLWHIGLSAVVGIIVSGTIAGRYVWRYVYHGRQPFGNARFATGWDLYQSGMLAKRGFILGSSHYGPLRFADYEPIIFIAGTGGGKTKAIVIPNMLELYQESLVVTDIKGEIYAATHEYRQAIGQAVYRFEPAASDTHCYNPLGLLRLDHLDEDLDTVFHTLIPDSRESLWADASRNIAKMLAMYTILEKKETPTLQSIYQMVCAPEFLDDITLTHQEIQNPRVKNLFGEFMMAKEETRRDFLLSAQEYF